MRKQKTISKILKLKETRKREIEMEVRKMQDEFDREEERLNHLEKIYRDSCDEFEKRVKNGFAKAKDVSSYHDFIKGINSRIKQQKKNIAICEERLSTLNNALVEAHKEKRAFEMLNDRELGRLRRERLEMEQKETDFAVVTRRKK